MSVCAIVILMREHFEFNNQSEYTAHEERLDEIALQAFEKEEFKDAVRVALDKLEAIVRVRQLLKIHFPEVEQLPDRSEVKGKAVGSNEFIIAKRVVELLRE